MQLSGNTARETPPVIKTISVDETGLGSRTPVWLSEENKNPSDACLREIVLVGSPPEDFTPAQH